MNLSAFTHFKISEMVLLLLFIIYILFPIATPDLMKPIFSSAIGLLLLFAITVSLFVYTNPILGILYIFVAYELIRRSTVSANYMNTPGVNQAGKESRRVHFEPEQATQDPIPIVPDHNPLEIVQARAPEAPNSFAYQSLEEEIVDVRAPVGKSDPIQFSTSSFQPIANTVKHASMY
jgi:hypothetical protein